MYSILAQKDSDDVRLAVAKNESTMDYTLDHLARSPQSSAQVRLAAISNPAASHATLVDVAADDQDPTVRRAAAEELRSRINTTEAPAGTDKSAKSSADNLSPDAVFDPEPSFKSSDQKAATAPTAKAERAQAISDLVAESMATDLGLRTPEQERAVADFAKELGLDSAQTARVEKLTKEGARGGLLSVVALGAALASLGIHTLEGAQQKQGPNTYGPSSD